MFIFVENFHIDNLLVVLEIFHVFNFRGTRVPMKIIKPRTFPDLRYLKYCLLNIIHMS